MNPWATSFDISGPSGPWVCSFNIGGFTSGLGGGGVFLPTFSAIAPIGAAGDILYNNGSAWEALELDPSSFEVVDGQLTIPAVSSAGTVTAVTVATANGISAAVADQGTTPILTLTLGAITPTSVNGLTLVAQSVGFTIAGGTTPEALTVAGTASISGTNTGDQTWSTLTGKPSFAAVATSGAYADLSGRPAAPAAQVNSDWNASSGFAQILNKPSLASVATSGAYADLSGTPSPYFSVGLGTSTLGSSGISLDGMSGLSTVGFIKRTAANTWGIGALSTVAVSGAYADLSGKPSLAAVATSGSYADLSSKPTIDTLLPSETGNSGKFLTTNGTSASWATVSASPGGSANQVQFNSSGAFAGTGGLTFDGVNVLTVGGGHSGDYPTGVVALLNRDSTESYNYNVNIQNSNGALLLGCSNGQGYVTIGYTTTAYPFTPVGGAVNTFSFFPGSGNFTLGAATVGGFDNNNGKIQISGSFTGANQGIAFGNDSIQTTIYRYGQSVLAIGPSNVLLGSLTGTTATDGWPYLPSTAGAPTGTPNNIVAGYSQVQIDPANGKLWAYYGGAWHYALFV